MPHLFAYGTLMCEDIMHEVAGTCSRAVPGLLSGFTRRRVRGEHYPALAPEMGARVQGVVYRGLSAAAWRRLDRFEGEMYRRQSVTVALGDGTLVLAQAYIVRARFRHLLEEVEWDFAEFLSDAKSSFRAGYKGYRAL